MGPDLQPGVQHCKRLGGYLDVPAGLKRAAEHGRDAMIIARGGVPQRHFAGEVLEGLEEARVLVHKAHKVERLFWSTAVVRSTVGTMRVVNLKRGPSLLCGG